jgi:hypothetical protein
MMVGDHFGKQPQPNCIKEMRGIKAAHGDMTFIALPDLGVRGNSHMFMQDRNNLQIADLIIEWIDKHVK